ERMHQEGLDTFNLRFIKPHDGDRYVIRLIEPIINNRQARGLDTASEELRRDAAERAYVRNTPQLTGPITLMQAQDKVTQAFLFFLPVFADWQIPSNEADRARLHIGWVYEPLVMQEILRGAHFNDDLFHYVISDITTDNHQRIYACEDYIELKSIAAVVLQSEIFGRQWQFAITPTEKYLRQLDLTEPKLVFISGMLATLLLAFLAAILHINLAQRRHTQAQNARLAALIEGTADAIIEVNLSGTIEQWNRGAEAMFGFSSLEAVGQPLTQLIVPEAQRPQAENELMAAIEQRTKTDALAQRCTGQGALLDVLVYTAPLLGEQNKVIGAATIIRDMSKLRAAERELKELNAHLETRVALRTAQVVQARDELESLVNALPYAVLAVSADGRIYKANQKSRERFASSGHNLLGERLAEVVPAEYYAQIAPWLFYLPEGQVNSGQYSYLQEQGLAHYQWILIPAISQHTYKGFYFVEQDVSILKNNKIKLAATLAEQEALLKSINTQFLLSITDQGGMIQSVNEPFCQFSGYRPEELIGKSHSIMKSGLHSKDFWGQVWQQILSGEPWRGEVCNRHRNGDFYWFDTVIAPIRGADGKIERFMALRSDISARKDAEAARNRISQLLTSVLNAASEVGIIATDLNGLITVFNRGAERLLGYSAEEMIDKLTPAAFHVPDEVNARSEELSLQYAEPIAGFDTFIYVPRKMEAETRQWTYVRKDKTEIPVMLTVTSIRNAEGVIEGYLGIAMDISEQLAAAAQVAAVTEQLLQAASVANLGIWTWVLSSNELHWNEQMFALYQQDPALQLSGQLNYQHWAERLVPEDLILAQNALQAAINGEAEYDLILRLNLPDGALRYIKAQGRVSRDKHGAPVSITGINIDITELYLHEEELRKARDLAQEASRAKSQFLANISHEIRTPMNAVLGMLQLLQTTVLTERQQEYSHNAIGAARSLLGLLNDVLDFSKIEAG
ncbi:MAG TPA: PAS domain S-box protein, partial [Cellvibrionaceae bacterium]|nr:PAS domain S-box protein [Cellvibrionaceae bacterium]